MNENGEVIQYFQDNNNRDIIEYVLKINGNSLEFL